MKRKRSRSTKLRPKHNLPHELWLEILSRLPVKSLLRFRSVSKSWLSFINDPAFARSHLTRFNNNRHESHLFLLQGNFRQLNCVVRCSTTFRATTRQGALNSRQLPVENLRNLLGRPSALQIWSVVGSIDGVFMLKNNNHKSYFVEKSKPELMLWNPSIRKVRILPPPPETHQSPKFPGRDIMCFDVGLGFDQSINDYKHVRFVAVEEGALSSIAIYTFGTNSWKEIRFEGKRCPNITYLTSRRIVSFRGVLYFLLRDLESGLFELVTFHLSSEVFASASLPANQSFNAIGPVLTLADSGSSVAVVFISENEGSIWVAEGIGGDTEAVTWSKRYMFASMIPVEYPKYDRAINFVFLKKSGEMILEWGGSLVTYYNLETHAEKVMLEGKDFYRYMYAAYVHFENLMLLN